MKHNTISDKDLENLATVLSVLKNPPSGFEGFRHFGDSGIVEIKMLGYDFASEHSFIPSSPERTWVNSFFAGLFLAGFPDGVFEHDFEIMPVEETYTVIQYGNLNQEEP